MGFYILRSGTGEIREEGAFVGATTIRPARPEDREALTALAMRSKASWGYSREFMARVAPLLSFDAVDAERDEVFVVEGRLGVCRLSVVDGRPFLDDLWVEPAAFGRGLGRALWQHAVERARQLGWCELFIESDPGAEGFYLRMGAVRIGEQRSDTGRMLPLLRYVL